MLRLSVVAVGLGCLTIGLAACSAAAAPDPLANTLWTVTDYVSPAQTGGMATALAGTEVTIDFGADGELGGSAGCNRFGGSYTVDGDSLTFSALAMTMMACAAPDGVMEQEAAVLSALGSVSAFALEGGNLQLLNENGQEVILASQGATSKGNY